MTQPHITTYPCRRQIDPLNLRSTDVELADVAHHLSLICRFNGAVPRFYSVAEHSVLVSMILAAQGYGPGTMMLGLLHDSPEYVMHDINTPMKDRVYLAPNGEDPERYMLNYRELEMVAQLDILEGLCPELKESGDYDRHAVDEADKLAYRLEHAILRSQDVGMVLEAVNALPPTLARYGVPRLGLDPEEAEQAFLNQFEKVDRLMAQVAVAEA